MRKSSSGWEIFNMFMIVAMFAITSQSWASGNENNNNSDTIGGSTSTSNAVNNLTNANTSTNANTNSLFNANSSNATAGVSQSGNSTNLIGVGVHGGNQYMGGNDVSQGQHQSNSNTLDNVGNASSVATGGNQHQGQGQHQNQNQQANNTGNAQNVNFNSHVARNNPNVTVFAPNPTSPCMMSFGGGGAGGGFGVMITGTISNENCDITEAACIMNSIGQPDAAVEIACTGKHAKETTLCRNVNANKVSYMESRQKAASIKVPASIATSHTSDDFGANVESSGNGFLGFKMDKTTNQYRWIGFGNGS